MRTPERLTRRFFSRPLSLPTASTLSPREMKRLMVYVPVNFLPFLAVPVTSIFLVRSWVGACAPAVDAAPSNRPHESMAATAARRIRDKRFPSSGG